MSNKKGLSTIIVTLILILLSLVAVGIVWVVVSNILQSGTEQTSSGLGQIFLSIGIENVKVESNGDVSVSVKRNAGEGDLSGINFIVSDGENSQVIKKSESLGELATKTFTITSAELTGVAFVKEVSIAPISGTEGKEKIGSVVDSFEKNKIGLDDLKDYGIVSWWRFEDDAKDEVGENDGTLQGSISFIDGKYGKAGNFDGSGDYISVADNSSLKFGTNDFSYAFWFNLKSGYVVSANNQIQLFGKRKGGQGNYETQINFNQNGKISTYIATPQINLLSTTEISIENWHHIAIVKDNVNVYIYVNNLLEGTISTTANVDSDNPLVFGGETEFYNSGGNGGNPESFTGQIDEVMIFNRALTTEQVKAIYEINLN